jgi:hypothetical protein
MARKHNAKHNRSVSGYPSRLAARGLSPAQVRMPFIDRKGRKHQSMDALLRANPGKGGEGEEED